MVKKYRELELEIIKFDVEDVITTSCTPVAGEGGGDGEDDF